MSRLLPLAILFSAALWAQQTNPLDLLKAAVPEGAQRIAYGNDPLQYGELRVPPGDGPHPVAVLVHGGCWVAKLRNLDEHAVALDLLRPMAAALTAAGIATWNLEYRRLGNPGGGWPGTFQDVARGADHLRQMAGQHRLDLTRAVAMGHSAGGHLATWLAARPKLPGNSELHSTNPLRLKGVVNLDGPADLKAALPIEQPVCGSPVITELMGGSPGERPERYRQGSPAEMLPLNVPQEVFAGQMFAAQTPPYEAAARRAGDRIRAVVLKDAGHFVFIDPGSTVWPEVLKSVRQLLNDR